MGASGGPASVNLLPTSKGEINTWRGTKSLGTTGGSNLQACYQRGVSNDPEKEEKKSFKNRIKKTRAKEGLGVGF